MAQRPPPAHEDIAAHKEHPGQDQTDSRPHWSPDGRTIAFLSNRQDEKALQSKKYRARLARAMVNAVDKHFIRIEEARRK